MDNKSVDAGARFLHIFLKINGLLPFDIIKTPKWKANPSICSFTYSCLSALIMIVFVIICQYLVIGRMNFSLGKFVVTIIFMLEIIIRGIRIVILYTYQLWKCSQLIDVINERFELDRLWQMAYPINSLYDRNFSMRLYIKGASNLIQLSICVYLFCEFPMKTDPLRYICFGLIQYTNAILITIASIYYWNMLMILHFYQNLNKKICGIVKESREIYWETKQIRMQKFCDISDEIDRIAIFYSRITIHTENVIHFHSFHLMMLMVDIFSSILSQVTLFFLFLAKYPLLDI